MNRKVFWEKVAENWGRKEEIKIPDIEIGVEVPKDFLDDVDVDSMDDLLNDLLSFN